MDSAKISVNLQKINSLIIFIFFIILSLSCQLSDYEMYTPEDLIISGVEKISNDNFVAYGGTKLILIKIANDNYKILDQITNPENIEKITVSNDITVCLSNKGNLSVYEFDNNKFKKKYLGAKFKMPQNIEFIKLIEKNLIFCNRPDTNEDIYKICFYSIANNNLIGEIITKSYWKITDVVFYNQNYFFIFLNGNIKYIPIKRVTNELTWKDLRYSTFDIEPECYIQNLIFDNGIFYLYCSNSVNIANIYKYKLNDQNNLSVICKIPLEMKRNVDMSKLGNKILLSNRTSENENLLLIEDYNKLKMCNKKSFKKCRFGEVTESESKFLIFGYTGVYKVNNDLTINNITSEN